MTDPEPDPIHKLDYRNPKRSNDRTPPSFDDGGFLLGLGAGIAASAVIWFCFFPIVNAHPLAPGKLFALFALAVPTVKVVLVIRLMARPLWRSCALGLFISIPVGGLIFFGACAANL